MSIAHFLPTLSDLQPGDVFSLTAETAGPYSDNLILISSETIAGDTLFTVATADGEIVTLHSDDDNEIFLTPPF